MVWILPLLRKFCEHLKRDQEFKLWQDGNHTKVVYSTKFFYEKLNYIHYRPCKRFQICASWVFLM